MRASLRERFGPSRAVLADVARCRVENQGYLGSCVAQTCTSAGEYITRQLRGEDLQFSALALYAWVREYVGTPLSEDSGSFNNTAARVVAERGFPLESDWPYDLVMWDKKPSPIVESGALARRLGLHVNCPNIATIEASIQQNKPVTVGFECFESIDSNEVAATGFVPFRPTESVVGGHAVMIVGYDRGVSGGVFYFLNSWGASWGMRLPEANSRGFGALPYEFVRRGYATETLSFRMITGEG
jgi:C1A family cysteine protease